jgi:hypothetical protein
MTGSGVYQMLDRRAAEAGYDPVARLLTVAPLGQAQQVAQAPADSNRPKRPLS